jgi:uncharacterized lipoprotein YddW (UPF0748 family)
MSPHRSQKLSRFFFFVFILLCFFNRAGAEEWRGVWVKKDSLKVTADIETLIQTAKDHHLNTLFVQVYAQGRLLDENLIQYLTQEAKLQGLAVHAWFNIFNVWNQYGFPKDTTENANHIYFAHPDWFLCDAKGRSLREYSFAQRHLAGADGLFLDPRHEQVQNDILLRLDDFVSRYEVAGVHLDYFRYPGKYFMSCENATPNLLPEIVAPHDENLTVVLEKIQKLFHQKYPKLFLSVAVVANRQKALDQYAQDWGRWLKEDKLDFVALMSYSTDRYTVKQQILKTQALTGEKSFYLMGLGAWRLSVHELADRIQMARNLRERETPAQKGFVLFAYDHLKKKLKLLGPISK